MIPKSIIEITEDNLSGSVTLLKRLMSALEIQLMDPDLDPARFIGYIEYLRDKMETFTVIRHFCDELILSHNVSTQHFPANYLDFINDYKVFWEQTPRKILTNLLNEISLQKKTIMMHSNSGTLREVFRLMPEKERGPAIIQTLSATAEEGRIQAHDLANMGYKVTMIPDSMAAEKLKKCHYLILGADQLRKSSIINKVGSLQMVLAAQEFNVPVYVVTESRKAFLGSEDVDFEDKKRDPSEILKEIRHPNLSAENIYFEEIPNYMLTAIITEKKA